MMKHMKKTVAAILAFGIAVISINADVTAATPESIDELIRQNDEWKCEETDTVSGNMETEAYIPCTTDAFASAATLKGIQGNAEFDHYFMNCYLDTGFVEEGETNGTPYVYQGKTYYFNIPHGINEELIRYCNERGRTVSIKLLLRVDGGKLRLVDPDARAGGFVYYAPNFAEPEVAKEYEAFFHFLGERFSQADCHIDNWILGNEENMPAIARLHRSSTFYGTNDISVIIPKYAKFFFCVYNAVRTYTTSTRVSISVDHSWQDTDNCSGIPTRDFLDAFNAAVGSDTSWYISYHAYPAILYETDIWAPYSSVRGSKLNPDDVNATFVDGANLHVLTEYVRTHFGSKHRIMLTEVGFSQNRGTAVQAASYAYTYYAAKYSGMVDCLILYTMNLGGKEDYTPGEQMVGVFFRLDTGNPADENWISSVCLSTIGVSSWSEIIPGYQSIPNQEAAEAFITRLYNTCLLREPDKEGLSWWTDSLRSGQTNGANVAHGFFFSREYESRNLSDETYIEDLYRVMLSRPSDEEGKNYWLRMMKNGISREGIYQQFVYSAEYKKICDRYGISIGNFTSEQPRDKNPSLTAFVARLYTKALERNYDADGLNYWCDCISKGSISIDASSAGFFQSQEFLMKQTSDEEYIKILYRTFLDREYDKDGYNYWCDLLKNGSTREEVMSGFLYSEEFSKLKASFGVN